ncbi:MAG TPA: glycosyltransferase family 39 protein [Bryobacteraceae bacterium]|nr:glycosyltransferase family 39 protein [Bryobacteraceae bacterium]
MLLPRKASLLLYFDVHPDALTAASRHQTGRGSRLPHAGPNPSVLHKFLAAVLLGILCAAIGLCRIHWPLFDDQTLFLRGAEAIRDGGTLYRDYWDFKPPGIFFLYFLGGRIFGFTDLGMHLLELVILVSFAVIAFLCLRDRIGLRAAWLGAFLAVLFYYGISDESDLGNVEGLACLPASIAAFLLLSPRSPWRIAIAGLAAGLLILLKPFYGLLGVAFWAVFFLAGRSESRRISTWLILLAAAAVPIFLTILWFLQRGALPDLINAVIRTPNEAKFIVNPMTRIPWLKLSIEYFLKGIRCLLILLIPAAWAVYERRNRATMVAVAFFLSWMGAGTIAILLQFQSWWRFHWLLILPPIAFLAGMGADFAISRIVRRGALPGRVIAVLLLAVALWTARSFAHPLIVAARSGSWDAPPHYAQYRRQLQYAAGQVRCTPADTALIWLSPIVSRFSGCRSASAVYGTYMLVIPPSVFARVREDLRSSSPRFIYLRLAHLPAFRAAFPGLLDGYVVQYQDSIGSWYRRLPD